MIEMSKIVCHPDREVSVESIRMMAASIGNNGLINPITLTENIDGTYTIIAGRRRFF